MYKRDCKSYIANKMNRNKVKLPYPAIKIKQTLLTSASVGKPG